MGPATSPYIYAQPGALNGALNSLNGGLGNSSQSPSPGYGQSGLPGPTGGDIYYNGATHPAQLPLSQSQHQPMYPIESSPAHSEVSTCQQMFGVVIMENVGSLIFNTDAPSVIKNLTQAECSIHVFVRQGFV